MSAAQVVVAGIGSEYRCDDGVGPAVARSVAASFGGLVDLGAVTEPLDLLGRWDGAQLAVIVDATRSAEPPGTITVLELRPLGECHRSERSVAGTASTHGVGLVGAYRIACVVGGAPRRVVVIGIEGEHFGSGIGLSPSVERAAVAAAVLVGDLVGAELRNLAGADACEPDPLGSRRVVLGP